ncbi:MAG: SDR family oxidoreductase [Desulfobacterales bacterium]|nr:SDR family oxidoreductase [Desulfobacterales bacterium]
MRLSNKTALITGASRNIGKHIALSFAREGADLILNTSKSRDLLDAAAAECQENGVRVITVMGDVSVSREAKAIVHQGLEELGKIDILVSNAAIRPHKPIIDLTDEEWLHVLNVNLTASFYLFKAVLPHMMSRGSGSMIAMGGQVAITGKPYTAAVAASKTGLLGLVRATAAEMAPHGIRVNSINPGRTDTERHHPEWYPERVGSKQDKAVKLHEIPLRRLATKADIANACLFLASDEAAYITGEQLNVVGGRYMV